MSCIIQQRRILDCVSNNFSHAGRSNDHITFLGFLQRLPENRYISRDTRVSG